MRKYSIVMFLSLLSISNVAFAETTSTLRPTADGGNDDASWTNTGSSACDTVDCFVEVDESSGAACTNSDGDTSYIESSTNGANQTFDIDESSIPDNSTITQIDITICAIKGGGEPAIQTRRCVDGTCTSSGSDIVLTGSYVETTQSHTGLSIVKSASTDIEIGVANTTIKTGRVSQISAQVTYTPPADSTAPAAVSDLALSGATTSSINLAWTAPGDDGSTGIATTYDVRYSTSAMSEGNWSSATQATGEPSPSVAGSAEAMTVTGLSENTTYFFAIKTSDEVPNEAGISNVPSLATTGSGSPSPPGPSPPPPPGSDTTAPVAVTDLALSGAIESSIVVSWTAPGDDADAGTAASYDIRYSPSLITNSNWALATQVIGELAPAASGTTQSITITGLTIGTTYFFAMKTSDEIPNESALSNVVSLSTIDSDDTATPSAISDLSLSDAIDTSITLSWTAPGDDGDVGTANTYDVRHSTFPLSEANWSSASEVSGEPSPAVAGDRQSMTISGLFSDTLYYFALKTSDEALNESAISNVPTLATLPQVLDTTAPGTVSDLTAVVGTSSNVLLSWTASGDDGNDGVAAGYEVRYSTLKMTEDTWQAATHVLGEPNPSSSGSSETMTVLSLDSATAYHFGIKALDEAGNASRLSNVPTLTTGSLETKGRRAIVSGQAYPQSIIELLRRRTDIGSYVKEPVETLTLLDNGLFRIIQEQLIGEQFLFALRVTDPDGANTGILTFNVDLRKEDEIIAKDIFVPPTIKFEAGQVARGKDVTVFGYSAPHNKVELQIDGVAHGTVQSDEAGRYTVSVTTEGLDFRNHHARTRQVDPSGRASNFSQLRTFRVSALEFPESDFNDDDEVNITDWSIFLFRWGSSDESLREKIDLDANGKVDIIDFSIFLKTITI